MLQQTNESVCDDMNKMKIFDILLQHDGLLASIIQWGFWKEYRPDISKVLDKNECTKIVDIGRRLPGMLINLVDKKDNDGCILPFTEEDKQWMRMLDIGTIPIISNQYDPNNTISFVEGLILTSKATNDMKYLQTAEILIVDIDLVDKGVITQIIDFGINCVVDDIHSAELVSNVSAAFLEGGDDNNNSLPSDTRAAFAIRVGLLDMCLSFIEDFGRGSANKDKLFNHIENIFHYVYDISFHNKTRKAIRHKKEDIEEKLLTRRFRNISITEDLLDMARSILNLNGSYCCRCNKSLSKTEVKECNGCDVMTYCSTACQREDWLHGHKLTCCKTVRNVAVSQFQGRVLPKSTLEDDADEQVLTYDQDGQFQGCIKPTITLEDIRAAAKLKELETNITTIQLKLFLTHSEYIMNQASSLNIPLWDCVVVFDLRCCPPTVQVVKYTDHYMPKAAKEFRKTRSKENITCIYMAHIDTRQSNLCMQRIFPHAWLYLGTDTINTSNNVTSKRRVAKVSSRWRSVTKKASGSPGR